VNHWEAWGLNEKQTRAVLDCVEIIRGLPSDQRGDVCLAIKHNESFCVYCGRDSCDQSCANDS
jgi:hypothetical protein